MKKKCIFLLLALIIVLICFCACSESEEVSVADNYLSLAQSYLDNNDTAAALEMLQKGFLETKDSRLAVMIAEITSENNTVPPTETVAPTTSAPQDAPPPHSYAGIWAEKTIGWESGGLIVEISPLERTLLFDVTFTQAAPYSRVASFSVEILKSDIQNNQATIAFDNDGWDNSGAIAFQFLNDSIVCTIKDTKYLYEGEFPMFGIYEGEYLLIRQEDAYDRLYDDSSDYTDDTIPAPTSVSVASPPLTQVSSDLLYWGANCFRLGGEDTYLTIQNIELQYVRKEYFTNIFTYSVHMENEYYAVDATYDMCYVCEGNTWLYNSHSRTDYISYAIQSQIDQNKVIKACEERFDTYQILDHTYYLNEDKVFIDTITFQGTLQSKYITEVFSGTYTYRFEDDSWRSDWDISRQPIDWSSLEGQWVFEHYDEFIQLDILDITQKDSNELTVTYSYETSPWYDDGPWEGYFNSSSDGSSRSESNLVRTCEINLKSEDFTGNYNLGASGYNYTHLYPCAFSIPLEIGGWEVTWYEGFFVVYFDINKGFYISEFQYLYKDPAHMNSYEWHNSSKQKAVYFQKQGS